MTKLIAMKGLPASGKSSKAKEIMETSGNTVRVNKDLLRKMLHNDKFTGRNEGITHEVSKLIVQNMLIKETNVIVDDTNLNPKIMEDWKNVAKTIGAKFEIVEMDTDVHTCVVRDMDRADSVGGHVIKNMALQYGIHKPEDNSVIICDLDGTLCDITHRLHYVKNINDNPEFKKDWKGFFSGIAGDKPRKLVVDKLIEEYNKGTNIIYVSARPETYRKETEAWLAKHNLSFGWTLIMRPANDKREDTEVKKDILKKYFPNKKAISLVIDDRPSVIRMWREQGLEVWDVGSGKEF